MAIKAQYAQSHMNGYTRGNNPSTYAAMEQAERDANIRAGKSALKVIILAIVMVFIVSTTSGCDWNRDGKDDSIGCAVVVDTPACK